MTPPVPEAVLGTLWAQSNETFGLNYRRIIWGWISDKDLRVDNPKARICPSNVLIIPSPIDRYHTPRSASQAVDCMALLGGVEETFPCLIRLLEFFHLFALLSRPPCKTLERGNSPFKDAPRRYAAQEYIKLFVGRGLGDEHKRPIANRKTTRHDLFLPFKIHQRVESGKNTLLQDLDCFLR